MGVGLVIRSHSSLINYTIIATQRWEQRMIKYSLMLITVNGITHTVYLVKVFTKLRTRVRR